MDASKKAQAILEGVGPRLVMEQGNKILSALKDAVQFQNGQVLDDEFFQTRDTTVFRVKFLRNDEAHSINLRSNKQKGTNTLVLKNTRTGDTLAKKDLSSDPSMDTVETQASILISREI